MPVLVALLFYPRTPNERRSINFTLSGIQPYALIIQNQSHCAGIDIGSESIFVGIEDYDVASFGTFTDDYLKAIAYLKEHHITAVAMGSYRSLLDHVLRYARSCRHHRHTRQRQNR